MLNREEIDRLLKMEGECKGVVLQTDAEYVKKKWGEDGMQKLKSSLKQSGCPIEYEKIGALESFPIGLRAISLLAIKDTFKLDDEEIKAMGNTAPKFSFVVKLMMRAFISPQTTVKFASNLWSKHYSVGTMESEFNEKERFAVARIKNINLHPIFCKYLEGYFQRMMQYTINKDIISKEVECNFKGDLHHTYKLSWS